MIRKLLFFFALFLSFLWNANAQTNMGFELWGPSTFSNNEPNGWGTSNADAFFIPGPMSTFQETTSPGELLSSVRMVTTTGYGLIAGPGNDTLPGLVSLGVSLFTGLPGVPYTSRPDYVSFMYKSNPMTNDTNAFKVQLSHWDGTTTITDGDVLFTESTTVGTWTTVILPIAYQTALTPDTLKIIASSSIGFLSGTTPYIPGSEFFIDDINLIFCNINTNLTTTDETGVGSNDGTAAVIASGGFSPYTYLWSNGQTSQTALGLAPGTYTVVVTDSIGCSTNATAVINPFTCSMTAGAVSTAETSLGANDGTATASVIGGLSPYSYLWSDGQTTQVATGLIPGVYVVTVTDVNGCSATATVNVNSASCNLLVTPTATDETSVGANDGTVTANATLGATPFAYLWSNGQTTQTITGLAPGMYTVTVSDANGCTAIDTAFVNAYSCSMSVSATVTNETLLGANDGTSTVTASGGTSPFSYLWSDGQTTQTAVGLAPGNYTAVVSDINGCVDSTVVVISAASNCTMIISASATDETSVGANDGTATVSSIFGASPYTYLWSNGQTTQTIVGLAPGTYSVTVTDFYGCVSSDSVTLQGFICSFVINASSTAESSLNANDGTATVITFFGIPPYTYLWSDGQTTQTAVGLSPSNYSVTATDSSGCVSNTTITVQAFSCSMTINTSVTDETNNGSNDGTASVIITNGLSPYVYTWSDGQTTQMVTGLAPGGYSVSVVDSNGCVANDTVVIQTFSCSMTIAVNTTDETSFGGGDGTATAIISNSLPPYAYSWSDGQTTQMAVGLSPGGYSVSVVDSNGCIVNDSVVIQAFVCSMVVIANVAPESYLGANNGAATASAYLGTPPYSYSWSNGQSTQTVSGLAPGTYIVIATDSNGCSVTDSVTVAAGAVCTLTVSATSTDETVAGANDGSATAIAAGGTSPYTYSWSSGQTIASITGLSAGIYTVTATDANGCTATASVTITAGPNGISTIENELVKVYPNPTGSIVTFDMANLDVTHINLIDVNGKIVKAIYVSGSVEIVNVSDLPTGIYYYQIMNNSLVVKTDKLSVIR